MTKHIPLTFNKPDRWLRILDDWNDDNNRDLMSRIEKLSVTFNNWKFVTHLHEMIAKENQGQQIKDDDAHRQHLAQEIKQRFSAAIRPLIDHLINSDKTDATMTTKKAAPLLVRLSQLYLNLVPLPQWPDGLDRHPSTMEFSTRALYRSLMARNREGADVGRRLLLPGLEEAFRLGFDCTSQLTTLHIIATEDDLASLLCKALEDRNSKLCANLEEFSGRYIPNNRYGWKRQLWPLFVRIPLEEDFQVGGLSGTLAQDREVEVKCADEAIELFVARCPKLKRLEVQRPREHKLGLHPLAAEQGLEVLNVNGRYMDDRPICMTLLGRLATANTEIQLMDVTALVRDLPWGSLIGRWLGADGMYECLDIFSFCLFFLPTPSR